MSSFTRETQYIPRSTETCLVGGFFAIVAIMPYLNGSVSLCMCFGYWIPLYVAWLELWKLWQRRIQPSSSLNTRKKQRQIDTYTQLLDTLWFIYVHITGFAQWYKCTFRRKKITKKKWRERKGVLNEIDGRQIWLWRHTAQKSYVITHHKNTHNFHCTALADIYLYLIVCCVV